ncbi:MAG TPA: phosphatase PAP2 family protein [Polyangiaceae bacterium]|nr:phosphatase PAP2 family protein [Polyangiaceae bacterium]
MLDARFARSRPKRRAAAAGFSRALCAALLALAATLGMASVARADQELSRVALPTLSLELGAVLLLGSSTTLIPIPTDCHWCVPPKFDQALASPVKERRSAGRMSHVLSYVAVPVLAGAAMVVPPVTTNEPNDHAAENLVLVAEVVLLDLSLNLAIKRWVARRRPAFYYGRVGQTEYAADPKESNLSFFSGDTSGAFSAASAAATISFMRGYESAPYVTAVGATLATATGLLRIGADVHWPSDVLTGALVGTALGIAMPLLLHPRAKAPDEAGANATAPLRNATMTAPLLHFSAAF